MMRAEQVGSETLLAQIVRMVSEAQRSRAPDPASGRSRGRLVRPGSDRRRASLTFVVWVIVGPAAAPGACAGECRRRADHRLSVRLGPGDADVDHGRHRPRRAAGVLIRNAEALELLEKVDTLVVDKTGTLTEGKPRREAVVAAPALTEDSDVLAYGGQRWSSASEHPLARAIVERRREQRSRAGRASTDFQSRNRHRA